MMRTTRKKTLTKKPENPSQEAKDASPNPSVLEAASPDTSALEAASSDASALEAAKQSEASDDLDFPTSEPSEMGLVEEDAVQGEAREEEDEAELWGREPDPVIPPRWRPYFPLAVFFITLWLMVRLWGELSYFWAGAPIDLGEISDGCQDDFYKKALHNRHVKIRDVFLQSDATTEARVSLTKYNYTFAMGCDLLVAIPSERYRKIFGSPAPSSPKAPKARPKRPSYIATPQGLAEKEADIQTLRVQGRLLRLDEVSTLEPVIAYYRRSQYTIEKRTLVLFDGEHPRDKWWVFLLYAVFLGLCLMSLQRFFVFVRAAEDEQQAEEEEKS
jgi:hypothetical protein